MWRDAVKGNRSEGRKWAHFIVQSDEEMVGKVLVEAGFFPSTSEVKRNQPELFRMKRKPGDTVVKLSWAAIRIVW